MTWMEWGMETPQWDFKSLAFTNLTARNPHYSTRQDQMDVTKPWGKGVMGPMGEKPDKKTFNANLIFFNLWLVY